jgi:hypothetical protein
MDLSTKLPAEAEASGSGGGGEAGGGGKGGGGGEGAAGGRARLVVGSLDVNVGAALPAEELRGRLPDVSAWGGARLEAASPSSTRRRRGLLFAAETNRLRFPINRCACRPRL